MYTSKGACITVNVCLSTFLVEWGINFILEFLWMLQGSKILFHLSAQFENVGLAVSDILYLVLKLNTKYARIMYASKVN
jgi:hypothetical protein